MNNFHLNVQFKLIYTTLYFAKDSYKIKKEKEGKKKGGEKRKVKSQIFTVAKEND